jgi:hypothetical protein
MLSRLACQPALVACGHDLFPGSGSGRDDLPRWHFADPIRGEAIPSASEPAVGRPGSSRSRSTSTRMAAAAVTRTGGRHDPLV